jgi:hypothetical protein
MDGLQQEKGLTRWTTHTSKYTDSWVIISTGLSACFFGILLPILDKIKGRKMRKNPVTVMRCACSFLGMYYAVLVYFVDIAICQE